VRTSNICSLSRPLLEDLVARETVELAFIIAIQLLPEAAGRTDPARRLGWSAKEAAEALDDTVAAVTSACSATRQPGRNARHVLRRARGSVRS